MLTFQIEKCELDLGDSGPVAFFGQFKANIDSAAFVWNITFLCVPYAVGCSSARDL